MLSKNSHKMLKWISKHDKWMSAAEIRQGYKPFEDRAFKAISEKYLEKHMNMDGDSWVKYRISDLGKAYLEGARQARQANIREWLSFGLSIAAIIISIIALLMQAAIL